MQCKVEAGYRHLVYHISRRKVLVRNQNTFLHRFTIDHLRLVQGHLGNLDVEN